MLDVETGRLWWYNKPPAEPAFCSQPAAFCTLGLLLHPLIPVYVSPIHLFWGGGLSLALFHAVGSIKCMTPPCCSSSCRGREGEWAAGVNEQLHKGRPFIALANKGFVYVDGAAASLLRPTGWSVPCR